MLRAVNAYVGNGFLPKALLVHAGPRETDRLPAIVAVIKGADPDITLHAICPWLEAMREGAPRGRTNWQPSSVKKLPGRDERLVLLEWSFGNRLRDSEDLRSVDVYNTCCGHDFAAENCLCALRTSYSKR